MAKITITPTKTDNSHLADKVGLRVNHLPRGPITVLDCFAGTGRIWRAVKRRLPDREIKILGIDKQNYGFHLPGDNVAWLQEMDLSRFNVIDLDSYGMPYDQLRILFSKKYHGQVFVTFVQLNVVNRMPKRFLFDIGFTEEMYQKSPLLLCRRGFEYFQEWLALKGLKHYAHRWNQGARSQKHYLAFTL